MLKLQIIVASTRPGRAGLPIAQWFYNIAKEKNNFELELIDLKEVNLPFMDEPEMPRHQQYIHQHTKDWSAKINTADAYVFILPEYNYGFPAPLKNAMDYLLKEWQYKPVGLVNYGGTSGGTRSAQMMKQVITTFNMMPLNEAVNINFVEQYMEDGIFKSIEKFDKAADNLLTQLAIWAKYLKELREEIRSSQ